MLTLQNQRSTVTQQGLMGPRIQCDTAIVTQQGLMDHCGTAGPHGIKDDTTVVTLQGPMDPRKQVTGLVGLA